QSSCPAGSVRHRPEGADGPRHDELGRAHGRGVHSPPARDGCQGEGGPRRVHQDGVRAGARAHRVRSARGAARGDPKRAQRDLFGRRPGPVRDRAGSSERDRARYERSKGGLEHRGLPHVAGEGRGRTPEAAGRCSSQGRAEARSEARTQARSEARTQARSEARTQARSEARTQARDTEPVSTGPENLQSVFERTFAGMSQVRGAFTPQMLPREVGTITSIAFNVDKDEVGVVLLGEYWHLHAADEVERAGRVMDVAVGDGLVGRVIDPLGRPLDDKGPVISSARLPIERPAAAIMDRAAVTVPLQTGLKVVDALIPIGRGQRELILGDRQTGKTAIAMDTILNQRGQNVLCVYCAIGQRASAVAKAVANLREKGAMEYTVVVVTEGNDPPGLA